MRRGSTQTYVLIHLLVLTVFFLISCKKDKKYCFLNEKQKVAFGGMFDEIDKDKNGSVTLEELKMRMVPAVSKSDIKHFVQVGCSPPGNS